MLSARGVVGAQGEPPDIGASIAADRSARLGCGPGHAKPGRGKGLRAGYYSGRTSQGATVTFVVAGGQVSELLSRITDTCHPGNWYVTLYPHASPINAHGSWTHRTPGAFPTVYHGHLSGDTATGTIDDRSKNNAGRTCTGHVSFRATRGGPLRIGSATVGTNGTDVLIRLRVPAVSDGNSVQPDTGLALLVYGSNTGCRTTYQAADAQARSVMSHGFIGLIDDAYVTADYGAALIKGYSRGTFTFDVSTNTLLRTDTGASPFSTVCAMLYSGKPATLRPTQNVAVDGTKRPLVPGPGIPVTQP